MKTFKFFILYVTIFILAYNFSIAQWEECEGLSGKSVRCIAVKGDTIFAGTWGEGVFVSTDNGNSWFQKNNGLSDLNIWCMAITENKIFIGLYSDGIFLSTDNGENWIKKTHGYNLYCVQSMTINKDKIFAGSVGIYSSTDFGDSWIELNIGSYVIFSMDLSNDTIIAGADNAIFITTDNGENWSDISNDEIYLNYIYSIAICNNNYIIGTRLRGVFLSTDNGNTWNTKNNGLSSLRINSLAKSRNNIFAGTGKGFFLTSNLGDLWIEKNEGLLDLDINAITIDGNNIFVGTSEGLFKTYISKLTSTNASDYSKINSIDIYPNPASALFEIVFNLQHESTAKLIITNSYGQQVYNANVNYVNANNEQKYSIDIRSFPSGLYFITLRSPAVALTKKVIILK